MDHLLDEELGFIIRSKGQRHLIYRGRKDSVYNLALGCALCGRYSASHLSHASEYDGNSDGCGLLCDGVLGIKD